jgi:hypothetical protein
MDYTYLVFGDCKFCDEGKLGYYRKTEQIISLGICSFLFGF